MPVSRQRQMIKAAAELLDLDTGATIDDVVSARRALAKLWHPDINPETGSAQRMGQINLACDLLCDFLRAGGEIVVTARGRTKAAQLRRRRVQQRTFVIDITELNRDASAGQVGVAVAAPDRYARVEIDKSDATAGGIRVVRFVRSEPGRCIACAGMGALPSGPKRVCPACGGASVVCPACEGRGWLHLSPGTCPFCEGTGAGLVESSIRLALPPGVSGGRVLVRGWGDLLEDGTSGNLWVDLIPAATEIESAPWRFDYFGHSWPRPVSRLVGEWLFIVNEPLPDDEMRELGFWRDPDSREWTRQVPSQSAAAIVDHIRQRQFFVPRARAASPEASL